MNQAAAKEAGKAAEEAQKAADEAAANAAKSGQEAEASEGCLDALYKAEEARIGTAEEAQKVCQTAA